MSGLHPLECEICCVYYCEYGGKLTLAELIGDKWSDEESFLETGRRVCNDRAAAANLEEEDEEDRLILRGHPWLTRNTISHLELAVKYWKEIITWLEPMEKTLSCAICPG